MRRDPVRLRLALSRASHVRAKRVQAPIASGTHGCEQPFSDGRSNACHTIVPVTGAACLTERSLRHDPRGNR